MNLIIDRGNTAFKIGIYKNSKLKNHLITNDFTKDDLDILKNDFKIEKVILSSVANIKNDVIEELTKFNKHIILDHKTKIPFINKYETPETLGRDRMANAAAAVTEFPNKNVLVIDLGTCMKFDLINADKAYLGGAISPGLKMRYKALNTFTAKLPLLPPIDKETFIGTDTKGSINSGVFDGMLHEINGWIKNVKNDFEAPVFVLTGGDTIYFEKALKNSIFANHFFTLNGLNAILESNF